MTSETFDNGSLQRQSQTWSDKLDHLHSPKFRLWEYNAASAFKHLFQRQCANSYVSLNIIGEDKRGIPLFSDLISRSRELEQWRAQQGNLYSFATLQRLDYNLDMLFWILYVTAGMSLLNFKQINPPEPPSRPMPLRNCEEQQSETNTVDDIWIPYPNQRGFSTFHQACHFTSLLSMTRVVYQGEAILKTAQGGTSFDTEQFSPTFQMLQDWPSRLPECMKLTENSNPQVIALQ